MTPVLVTLIQNAALLLAIMVVSDLGTSRKPVHGPWGRQAPAGLILGGLCIGLMLASVRLEAGIVFDTRSVLLSLCGLFAMAMAAAYPGPGFRRLSLQTHRPGNAQEYNHRRALWT